MTNNCKFQGKRLIADVNTSSDEFGWRQYDPLVGRWHATDPAEQFANPYLAMGNTPTSFVDYDGAQGGSGGTSGTTDLEHSGYSYGSASDLGYNSGYDMYMAMHYGGGWGSGYMTSYGGFAPQIADAINGGGTGWNINHLLMEAGGDAAFFDNPSSVTGVSMNGNSMIISTRDYSVGDLGYKQGYSLVGDGNYYESEMGGVCMAGREHNISVNIGNISLGDIGYSLANIGFGMRLTADLYGNAAKGLEASRIIAAIGTGATYVGYAGVVLGAGAAVMEVANDPYSLDSYARAGVQVGALAVAPVPYVGIGLSIGIEVAHAAGAFDGFYNWAGQYSVSYPSPILGWAVYHKHK